MKVIWHDAVSQYVDGIETFAFFHEIDKDPVILILLKNPLFVIATVDHMVNKTIDQPSGCPRHRLPFKP
jgi:hypothetical protein